MLIQGPTQFAIKNPRDQNDQVLGEVDASATITIYAADRVTVVVPTTSMPWSSAAATWVYEWDTAGVTPAVYQVSCVLTPNGGLPQPQWTEVTFAETAPPPSTHYLIPWCNEGDIPLRRLQDSNGQRLEDVNMNWLIAAATDLLFVASGRQYRTGRSVVRPSTIATGRAQSFLYPYNSIAGWGGSSWGLASGWLWGQLGLGWENGQDAREVVLQGPVLSINEVMVDGVVLDPGEYSLFDERRLVRNVPVGGEGSGWWPYRQDLGLPLTQPGTWQIDYTWGKGPPPSGQLAAAELVVQLALGFSGQDACRLPARVLSIAQQGTNTAVGDALDYLKAGLFGVPIIDMFIIEHGSSRKKRRASFLSPDSVLNRQVG